MNKEVSQKSSFLASEGNNYFYRNKSVIERDSKNSSYAFYQKYIKPEHKVLEIGCSAGSNLNWVSENIGCQCYGIDPSQEAIEFGKQCFPHLNLSVGTSDILDFQDGYFDFVLFGFCLYLVDRDLLIKTVAEADRVLKNRGFLGITDFDVKLPRRRPYKHMAGISCFKMEYSKLFLAFPQYSMADKYCYSHSGSDFVEDINERVASVVLYKDHENAYFKED